MKIKILVMSVGPYEKNGTTKWLVKLGAEDLAVVCLPSEFEEYSESYKKRGIEVYIYNEKKYINDDFEFFGFKPRNCGGIGRQGIAEAVDKYGDEYICFELDDDTASYIVRNSKVGKSSCIEDKNSLISVLEAFSRFYSKTGIECMGKTGATPPSGEFVANHKIFNNFLMDKNDPEKGKGFAALCSDDYRYNYYRQLKNLRPMISTELVSITFRQSQGDRDDGNAVLYNGDCSWKKSYALKMMFPWCVSQRVKKESKRVLFRENILASKVFPPICISDDSGKIVGKLI